MGNVCNCVKGADSKSSKSRQPATEVELNGSKEEAVRNGSEEKTKAVDDEPQAAETTEVELEIAPGGSEANKTSEIQPTSTTSVRTPASEVEEKKATEIAETEEKTSEMLKKEPVEQEKTSGESKQNEAANGSTNLEERVPETTKEPSVNVNNTQAHASEDEKITVPGDEVSVADEKTGLADDAEVPSHNENKGATEEKITEPKEEVQSVVQAQMPQPDDNVTITEEEAKDTISRIEEKVSSIEANQGDLETPIQTVTEEHELPIEISSKPEVEVIQTPSGNIPDEKNSSEVSSNENAFIADSKNAELKSNLTAGEGAENLPSEINLSDEKQDSLNIGSSISGGNVESEVLDEKTKESEETPSAVTNTAESSQVQVEEEQNIAVEDKEHSASQSSEQNLDPQTTDDTTSQVVETNVETLPEETTLKQPEAELSDLQDTPLEVSQSNAEVPSNTPIHAAFLPLEKTANGKEPTLLDELGLADRPSESSLLDEVQKYVEEMVANGVAAVQEEELSKEDEVKSAENECSSPPEEGMDRMVDTSEKEDMMEEEASSDAQKNIEASEQEQAIKPGVVEEAAVTMEENSVLESIPLELRVEAEAIANDEEPAALEKTEKISNDLEQPVTIATIDESTEQQEDKQLVSNSPSPGDETEDNQVASQTEAKAPDHDEGEGAEDISQAEAEVANKAKIDLSTEEESNADEPLEKPATPTADQEELQKESPELELLIEKPDEQHEAIDILADPEEVIPSTSLHKDTADDVEEQGAATTEQSGDDSMVDSMLSLLEKKFPSSTLQKVETED